ncbi:MAG TPA: Holliday junction branch migration protein RuvA [Methylomirabilota bacterium]|nr:Holliday junction branch migration protein RuvA [Methylomirabilota bacterium]
MIAHLRGKLLAKKANKALIEVGGVGYDVTIPVSTFYELGGIGSDVSLHVYTHVREDALALYGFRTEREKVLFERFLTVSGVGPKMAIAILSGLELNDLIPALRSGNLALLTHIPGVGRKTAERLVLELREKLQDLAEPAAEAAPKPPPAGELTGVEADVLSALLNLGYTRAAAEAAVREARKEQPHGDLEALLRASLRLLARKFFSV